MSSLRQVAIIGAGPAGLFAAEKLAQQGCQVTVYDSGPIAGRKFLLAGAHGGLNLTNSEPLDSLIARYGAASSWLAPALKEFSPQALRSWCEGLGVETFVGTSGRVFPKEMHAKNLLRAWLARLNNLGVSFAFGHQWRGWADDSSLVFSKGDQEVIVRPAASLFALGGASWPRTGSDGGWYEIFEAAAIPLVPLRPANCGFIVPWSVYMARQFAGQPLKPVILRFEDFERQGEIMLTEKGIEGSLVYAVSSRLRAALEKEGKASLFLDLRPGLSEEDLAERLSLPRKSQSLSTYLQKAGGLSPLAIALIREATPAQDIPVNDLNALAHLIKNIPLTVTDTSGLTRAISTAGGVALEAFDPATLMLKDKQGIFLAGEMLDWEAPTGGYLMQGCFSTAFAAARGILAYLQK